MLGKMYDGDMLIRKLSKTLHQVFCKIFLNTRVIAKCNIDPDEKPKELTRRRWVKEDGK